MDPREEDLLSVGLLVVEAAMDIFAICGAATDFTVQSVGVNVVFGGTNRLLWNPKSGFRPDRPYCTDRFLLEFDAHFQGEVEP